MPMKFLLISRFLLRACTASYQAKQQEGIMSQLWKHDFFLFLFFLVNASFFHQYIDLTFTTTFFFLFSEDKGQFK